MKFVLNLLTLQTLRAKARIAANIQKSPHPNSHPLKNKCRALAVRHFFYMITPTVYNLMYFNLNQFYMLTLLMAMLNLQ